MSTMIEMNALPVGNGDCIHIRFSDTLGIHNIIIDSGPASKKRIFRGLLKHIQQIGEQVDLLCFTHIDDDHIKAAELVIPAEEWIDNNLIKKIWMNIPYESMHPIISSSQRPLSVASAYNLFESLTKKGFEIETQIISGMRFKIGEAELLVLSPDKHRHEAFTSYYERECVNRLLAPSADTSVTNGDSIAFSLELQDQCFLLLGDAHPDTIIEGLRLSKGDNKPVLLAKLAHHGSKQNISNALLEAMQTCCFLITSSSNAPRPSEETFQIIEGFAPEVHKTVYCNFCCSYRPSNTSNITIVDLTQTHVTLTENFHLFSKAYET